MHKNNTFIHQNQFKMEDFHSQSDFLLDSEADKILQLREDQSLTRGFFAGLIAAIIGGIIWGLIVYLTNYKIAYIAVAIGFLVGYAIKQFGKGIDPVFAYMGGALALFGCMFGNIFTIVLLLTKEGYDIDFYTGLNMLLNFEFLWMAISRGTDFLDFIFYAIATYEGFRFSRIMVEEEVADA